MSKARMYGYCKPVKRPYNQLRWVPKMKPKGEKNNDRKGSHKKN